MVPQFSKAIGSRIAFRHRGIEAPVKNFASDALVETRAGSDLLTLTRRQETELPASAKIRFLSASDDYKQAVAEARRLAGASGRVAQADLALVLDDGLAAGVAETWLFEAWAAREKAQFVLPPSALAIEPGDIVTLTVGTRSRPLRVTEVGEHGPRDVKALSVDPDVYGRVSVIERAPRSTPVIASGSPAAAFIDLPLLKGNEAVTAGYVAAVQQPWPGGVAVYSSAQSTGYALRSIVPAPATLGRTLDPLGFGPEGRIDWLNKVRVKLSFGLLASADLVSVLSGVNTGAIENADGGWEVIQFLNAALVDVATYELSGLLRGQAGTDGEMRASVAASARFVLLNSALSEIVLTQDELNLPLNWRFGPSNLDIGDASYQTISHAYRGLGLRPYSPSHVRGARSGGGDLTISWKRRTRVGGDAWEPAEVPLSEDAEIYEVEIFQGAVLKRTLTAASPSVVYTAALQAADFGAAQAAVSVKVYQKSTLFGRGTARAAVV